MCLHIKTIVSIDILCKTCYNIIHVKIVKEQGVEIMFHILKYDSDGWNHLSYEEQMETVREAIESIKDVLESGESQRENILNSSDSNEKKDEELIELMNTIYKKIDKVLSIKWLRPRTYFGGIYDFYLEFMIETVNCLQKDVEKIPALMKFCSLYYNQDYNDGELCSMICEFKKDEDKINVYEEYIKGKRNYYHSMFSRIILSFKSPEMQIQYLEDQFDYICRWAGSPLSKLEEMENGLDGEAKDYWISLYEKYKDTYSVCKKLLSERCVDASTVGKIGTTGINTGSIEKARKELQGALTTDLGVPNQV